MPSNIQFILNDRSLSLEMNPSITLLDLLRYHLDLPGTKIGCREGDCGACTVLVGELIDGQLKYRSITSCLTPIGNIHGKHVVSIEGINLENKELTLPQRFMVEEGGTQCGFCTVGFIVSLTGYCLNFRFNTELDPISTIDGNICRCTGYKSIERAVDKLKHVLDNYTSVSIPKLVELKIIPSYFNEIETRVKELTDKITPIEFEIDPQKTIIGGGTDLYVQKHDDLIELPVQFINYSNKKKKIRQDGDIIFVDANVTATEFMENQIIKSNLPNIQEYFKLIASTPIRNIATMAGNIVNASPIGDFTNIFLALGAILRIKTEEKIRDIPIKDFYTGYKQMKLKESEIISDIYFNISNNSLFNFEKVSKRTHLDIASVNSSILIEVDGEQIINVSISAGGVAPYPFFLSKTSKFLKGKVVNFKNVKKAAEIAQSEVSPISDIRGSKEYKKLLLRQLIVAHFTELFPNKINNIQELIQ